MENFDKISKALNILVSNHKGQISLEQLSKEVAISTTHLQKLFSEWVGVSPKKFLEFVTLKYAKKALKSKDKSINQISSEIVLSSQSSLHALCVKMEVMTPHEYRNEGENIVFNYSFEQSIFGKVFVASTKKGLSYLGFYEDKKEMLDYFKPLFLKAAFVEKKDNFQSTALEIICNNKTPSSPLHLHIKGTPFQIKVWEALLRIPQGRLLSYGIISQQVLQNKKGSRAVGTAIGRNPISYLIPCHRVIQASGNMGGYMWGVPRKRMMIGWEASKVITITPLSSSV